MPRDDHPKRTETTLPPLAWAGLIGAGLMLLLLVIGIATLIVILKDSRDHIRAQDAKTAVLVQKVRAAQPTAEQVAPLIGEARPVVRKIGKAVGPLSRSGAAIAAAVERLPRVARAVQAIASVVVPVLADVGRVNVARVLNASSTVAAALLERDRLVRALDSTNELLAQVRAHDLVSVSADAARQTPSLLRELLRVQRLTLETQKGTLETQLATLDIQRQALTHIESIDRKTGGTVPAQGAPVPAP
jgi:hypothetical protein